MLPENSMLGSAGHCSLLEGSKSNVRGLEEPFFICSLSELLLKHLNALSFLHM